MKYAQKIKLIALDLDDTTLRSDASLSPAVEAAIRRAISAGIEIVIASGRSFKSLPKSVLGIDGIRYAITSNGAAVCSVPDGKRLVSCVLGESSVREMLSVFRGELLETFIDGQAYCDRRYIADPAAYGCMPAYVDYVRTTRLPIDDMPSFILENIDRLDSIDVLCDRLTRAPLREKAEKEIRGVYVTSSSPRLIELADKNAGKAAGLRSVCELLGVSPENCAAFGNGDNDADMLRFAGLGVAVANASKLCLEAADLIGPSNNDDCVAKIFEQII